MKKVILDNPEDSKVIFLSEIPEHVAIFWVRDGIVKGIMVKEKENRWIVISGKLCDDSRFFSWKSRSYKTREVAIKSINEIHPDSEFYIDPEIKV